MNIPGIRFKGFTDAWEQRKLGEVADVFDGTHQTPQYTNLGVKFVSVENISTLETTKFISKEAYDKEYANKQAEKGDVLMTRIGDIGTSKVVETDEALAYYVTLALLKPKSIASDFLAYGISSPKVQDDIWKRTLHVAFPKKINLGEINQINITMPSSVEEQSHIGTFFRTLDNTIAIHKCKLDGLRKLKKAYLQVMFPQAGENVPRVRFAGFTSVWHEIALGEMLIERNEQIEESTENPLMSFVGNVGVVPKGEQYDRSFLVKDDNKKYKRTKLNDFIYSSNNLETGSIGFNKTGNAVISPVYSIFYSNTASESQFVGLLSSRRDFINKMIHYRQGVMYGQWRIHERDFLKIKVLSPAIDEQNKIILFFDMLDSQIVTLTEKTKQLTQLKSAYLQKMFT